MDRGAQIEGRKEDGSKILTHFLKGGETREYDNQMANRSAARETDMQRKVMKRKLIESGMAGSVRVPDATLPLIGKPVVIVNAEVGDDEGDDDGGDSVWVLIARGNEGYIDEHDVLIRMAYADYGAFSQSTWIVQRSRGRRNPVWTIPRYNTEGEGEFEQRHVLATRCASSGEYRFYFFNRDDEIRAIERASKKKISALYLQINRTSPARVVAIRRRVPVAEHPAGHLCVISDYLYFSEAGKTAREDCRAAQWRSSDGEVPVYTMDFARYCTAALFAADDSDDGGEERRDTAAVPAHVPATTRVLNALLSLQPPIEPDELIGVLQDTVQEMYTLAYTATSVI